MPSKNPKGRGDFCAPSTALVGQKLDTVLVRGARAAGIIHGPVLTATRSGENPRQAGDGPPSLRVLVSAVGSGAPPSPCRFVDLAVECAEMTPVAVGVEGVHVPFLPKPVGSALPGTARCTRALLVSRVMVSPVFNPACAGLGGKTSGLRVGATSVSAQWPRLWTWPTPLWCPANPAS